MTREDALKIFSVGFSQFLTRKGLTLAKASEILNVSTTTIHFIKSGKNFPSVEGIFTLIDNGMKLEEIFGEERAKILYSGFNAPDATDLFSGVPKPAEMSQEDFDRQLASSLKRLLGNFDIK